MKILDILKEQQSFHFLRPGELRGSYTNQQLQSLGFRQARTGAWYIAKPRWDQLIRSGQLKENDADHRAADRATGFWGRQGAGCVIMAQDTGRLCLAHRSQWVKEPGTWGTWGGATDDHEDPAAAVRRELAEEAGYTGPLRLIPLMRFDHASGFRYHNFLALVPREFDPQLNWENSGYQWFQPSNWPEPLHPGVVALLHDQHSQQIIHSMSQAIQSQRPKQQDIQQIEEYSEFDIHSEFFEELSRLDPGLFEDQDEHARLRKTLKSFDTPAPNIGSKYIFTSVASTPAGRVMNIARFPEPHLLVDQQPGHWVFDVNGSIRSFPDSDTHSGDLLRHVFLFSNQEQLDQMLVWLNLNFSAHNRWRITNKIIAEGKSAQGCGDCFQAAGRAMIGPDLPELKLVHAYVSGQGPLKGRRFPHAWNEIGDVVLDNSNGRRVVMRREQYYKLGQVSTDPGQYRVYDDVEAKKWMARTRHWGPWQLQDSLDENFADGRHPGRRGLSRRVGIPKKATLAQLERIAGSSTGERRRMAQWQLNMRRGRKKAR